MSFSREVFLDACTDGVWRSELRSPEELSTSEIASRISQHVPRVALEWQSLCVPFIKSEADYDTMEEQNSNEWIYITHALLDPIYDHLPLNQPSTPVYRLETANGEGVFSHGVGLRALVAPENGCPQSDPHLQRFFNFTGRHLSQDYQKCWFFGCHDLTQLTHWLHRSDFPTLQQRGIEIGVYEISEQWCIHGHQQSIFQKDRAHRTHSLSLQQVLHNSPPKFKR